LNKPEVNYLNPKLKKSNRIVTKIDIEDKDFDIKHLNFIAYPHDCSIRQDKTSKALYCSSVA
jgi:hypothetical protein